jgi:hypothetical protein
VYVAPQLHTYAVIFQSDRARERSAAGDQPQSLFASQQFATAVYQSELTYRRLKGLGYEITVAMLDQKLAGMELWSVV